MELTTFVGLEAWPKEAAFAYSGALCGGAPPPSADGERLLFISTKGAAWRTSNKSPLHTPAKRGLIEWRMQPARR